MTEKRERRYSPRHQVSDSSVFCQESKKFGIFRHYSNPYPLNDLNRSGLGFQTDKEFIYGDKIHIKIEIPGHQKIQVIGEVRWVSSQPFEGQRNVGIQFLPFGTVKGYNSFSARANLERLITPLEQNYGPETDVVN